ncbi:hypothetical protein [Acinetobacter seifertii]|uniref:hypothetical protein n=1 Tax=Acinetobacter seifertii TaxID=1530123 RepID=UPI000D3B2242|nr:hypothetical protein [Acinetobacter seifertii]PTV50803.1 hypothetical protein DBL04_17210 [Acinetobacter seifertii]
MREFKLSKIWILSDLEKTANVFTFGPRMNLITSQKNSVGKSSLVKSILWTFGCEPYFDKLWKDQDVSCRVEFTINSDIYTIFRHKNDYLVIKDEQSFFFNDFRKYVDFFCNLFNFFPMLENRSTKILELPSPAYYFIPFYIDQKRGWSSIFGSFKNLGQYPFWQKPILNYHCGITNDEISKLDYKISKNKFEIKVHEEERKKVENTIEIVSEINEENNFFNLNRAQLDDNLDLIDNDYESLIKDQNFSLSQLNIEKNIILDLKAQRTYSLKLAKELENDFFFATENISTDSVECPLCGTHHKNSLLEKSKLVKEKDDLFQLISQLDEEIYSAEIRLNFHKEELFVIGNALASLHTKISFDTEKLINCATTQRSINLIENKANQLIENKNIIINKLEDEITKNNGDKKLINNKFTKNEIFSEFREIFTELNSFLNTDYSTDVISKSNIYSYTQFDTNGGAADSTRSIFLYHSILIKLIEGFSKEVTAPFIIDTPNQQEQAKENYEKIISTLFNRFSENMQIFLCAMENTALDSFKENANVITLSCKKSLLQKEKYIDVLKYFNDLKKEIDSNTIITF